MHGAHDTRVPLFDRKEHFARYFFLCRALCAGAPCLHSYFINRNCFAHPHIRRQGIVVGSWRRRASRCSLNNSAHNVVLGGPGRVRINTEVERKPACTSFRHNPTHTHTHGGIDHISLTSGQHTYRPDTQKKTPVNKNIISCHFTRIIRMCVRECADRRRRRRRRRCGDVMVMIMGWRDTHR